MCEWQVLHFGITCSPCCATYALCKHARYDGDSTVIRSVEQTFYVDNCLDSLPHVTQAKESVNKIRSVLSKDGFEIRQWASNVPEVVSDLPSEALSSKHEMWLRLKEGDALEPTLGLRWDCDTDYLVYHYRPILYDILDMRVIYRILASQYDTLS